MEIETFGWVVVWVVLNGAIGAALGGVFRGQAVQGAAVAIVLGPIGWIGVFGLRDVRPKCPECRGVIVQGAKRCRHCGVAFGVKTAPRNALNVKCPECGARGFVVDPPEDAEGVCQDCGAKFAVMGCQDFG
jgi:predicted nucleic acid-binding Zn ribbon protein